MRDFSRSKPLERVDFTIDGDVFHAVGVAPAMAILNVSRINEAKDMGKVEVIMSFLDQVLEEESAERFAARLTDRMNPITIDQCASVAIYLIEEVYVTERPTKGPLPSQNGSESTGRSSTDGAQLTGTTPELKSRRVL